MATNKEATVSSSSLRSRRPWAMRSSPGKTPFMLVILDASVTQVLWRHEPLDDLDQWLRINSDGDDAYE